MTIAKLHKILGELIAKGHKRTRVVIKKDTFTHALEADGCVYLDVESLEPESVNLMDGDGGLAVDAKGCERFFSAIVLKGE